MIPNNMKQIMQELLDSNYEAYIIGGAVRDIILKETPHDWDIFTNATGEQILELFPNGKVIGGEERQAKILTVVVDGIEVSQYRANGDRTETGNNLNAHLATCDFTINAMAMDINENITDNHDGKHHLRHKILKFVGDAQKRIDEDPLRILRGIRFWTKYNLCFKDINTAIYNSDCIASLPQERVREEFMKIIKHPSGIENLYGNKFLYEIIPEFETVCKLNGGQYHDETVDMHMINAFKESCKITDDILLRFTCFLHDIGKGATHSIDKGTNCSSECEGECSFEDYPDKSDEVCVDSQIHFYEHEKVGAEIVEQIMDRLKFSKEEIKYVKTLVKLHMYTYKDKPGRKSYIRFFNKLEDTGISIEDYIMLIYCDHQGNDAKPRIKFGDFIKGNWLYKKYYECKYSNVPFTVKSLEISGKDLIGLGIKPGKAMGELLNSIFDEVMDAKLKNFKPELMMRVKEIIEEIK